MKAIMQSLKDLGEDEVRQEILRIRSECLMESLIGTLIVFVETAEEKTIDNIRFRAARGLSEEQRKRLCLTDVKEQDSPIPANFDIIKSLVERLQRIVTLENREINEAVARHSGHLLGIEVNMASSEEETAEELELSAIIPKYAEEYHRS